MYRILQVDAYYVLSHVAALTGFASKSKQICSHTKFLVTTKFDIAIDTMYHWNIKAINNYKQYIVTTAIIGAIY